MKMDLKEQKYVCTLAECQSLTQAAERLYISQPALSIYISNLEKNLGVPLFSRSGKKIILTYAGERYVEQARKMLALERIFEEELAEIQRESAGRLRIGISTRRSPGLMPSVVAKFEKRWPSVEVVIREGTITDLNELLKNMELDMIVLNQSDATKAMETISLYPEEFLLAVPAVHPLNEKAEYVPGERYRRISPEALNGVAMILGTPWQSSRRIEDSILKNYGIRPGKIRVIRSNETALRMVGEGLGVTFIREGFISSIRLDKPIQYYMLNIEQHREDVVVAYKKGTKLPEYMKTMVELLKEQGAAQMG